MPIIPTYILYVFHVNFFFFYLGLTEMFSNTNDHKQNLTQDYLINYLRSRLLLSR